MLRGIQAADLDETVADIKKHRASETPSQQMQRLRKELDNLQTELLILEKEEWPNNLQNDPVSSKTQMTEIEELREYMQTVVGSA
jgi:hypothetical protein